MLPLIDLALPAFVGTSRGAEANEGEERRGGIVGKRVPDEGEH